MKLKFGKYIIGIKRIRATMSNKYTYTYNFIAECDIDVIRIRKIMKGLGKITTKRKLLNPIYFEEFDYVCGQKVYILRTELLLGSIKKKWCDDRCDLHYAYQSIKHEKDFDGNRF